MAKTIRFAALFGAAAAVTGAFASDDGSFTWTWNPGMEQDTIYSLNWSGYVESGNEDSWVDPNSGVTTGLLSSATAEILRGKVATVIDPAYIGYNLVAFNATISGIFIVSVTDAGNVSWTGAQWVTSQQIGALNHYAALNFGGAANLFTSGPATLAYAASPDSDALSSIGAFSPVISNIAIAPVLTAIDANQAFGVTITGIPVPEPASFVAIGLGLAALAARRRRR